MSKYKVEFTLKQHTPIIHFQSDQVGATLRATELKPKFDKFISKTLKRVDSNIYEKYKNIIEDEKIFPKDLGSNSYKITIESNSVNVSSTPKAYVKKDEPDKTAYLSPYFANANKSITASGLIKVTIKSFNKELLQLLDEIKDYIFVYENFGTRQSKGFGSYLRSDITDREIHEILKKHINPVFILGTSKDYKSAFSMIDNFYKKIKMGINKPYFKSLLFQFVCQEYKCGWEKKFIKTKFPEVIHGEHTPVKCESSSKQEYRYIRAVLGLAEHNEFRPASSKKQVKIKSINGIERFKSPVTFKVFNNSIYLIFDNSYKQILNEEFDFKLQGKSESLLTLQEFDMYKFFKFVEKQEQLLKEFN